MGIFLDSDIIQILNISKTFIFATIGFGDDRKHYCQLSFEFCSSNKDFSSYRHVPEEKVAPLVLDEEEESEDQEKVSDTDEYDNNHP